MWSWIKKTSLLNYRMFYYFFKSRNNTNDDPVVIWLAGGPGCSGAIPLFYENGPFKIANNLSLVWNDYGWDKVMKFNSYEIPLFSLSTCRELTMILVWDCGHSCSYTANPYIAIKYGQMWPIRPQLQLWCCCCRWTYIRHIRI